MRVLGTGGHIRTLSVAEQLQLFLSVGSGKLHFPAWGLWHIFTGRGRRDGQDCKVPFPGKTELTPPTGSSFSRAL